MDIENMHPFCLPFSLCHESASGSAEPKSGAEKFCSASNNNNNNNNNKSTSLNNNNNNSSSNSNNLERSRSRSKGALSPLDDLFDGSNLSPLMSRPVFQEDSLADSSMFAAADSSPFHALHLDIDMEIDGSHERASPRLVHFEDENWFSGPSPHDCLIFSPVGGGGGGGGGGTDNTAASRNGKSHGEAHNDSQVFHIVDPIAIKSSPTLAQLNLNSNDDPTDALWGDSASSRAASCVADTNSTSILPANLHPSSDLHPSCAHLHSAACLSAHHSLCNHQEHNNHQAADYSSTHLSAGHSPVCHHLYHDQAGAQSTCLAVAPFRKKQQLYRPDLTASQVGCCLHQQHATSPSMASPLGQHQLQHQLQHKAAASGQCAVVTSDPKTESRERSTKAQQARCGSPAPLVTSSSSPLSSSSAQNPSAEGRVPENKLKENIEYLTVLLCNGSNKLEKPNGQQSPQSQQQQQQQQQQPQQEQSSNISSTIVKSYSTLAQSLATEPKLLLAHQSSNNSGHSHSNYYQATSAPNTQSQNGLPTNCGRMAWAGTSEASPQSANHLQHQQYQQHQHQWFKSGAIESSISAADSTAENHNMCSAHSPICSSSNVMQDGPMGVPLTPSRPCGMKPLSSLAGSNMGGVQPMGEVAAFVGAQQMCATWHGARLQSAAQVAPASPITGAYPMGQQQQQQQQQQQHCSNLQEANSIPPNGRPITLTPLMSNNVIIGQRPSPQRQSPKPRASKVPTFAQPASPSASSTTSSSGNTEIGSTSLATSMANSAPSKRQRASAPASAKSMDGRPSSLSTECSLSSHDEGFSSQVDQDDCMNSTRDESEDESDVDSDDESFYGDYTNNDLIGASISDNPDCKWTLSMGRARRNGQRRFFWQYNVQSKGPKGTRIASADGSENPFVLPEASDPVFSNDCQIEGVKHSGKARRGDGNDLTPNPRKLLMIGLELKKLSKIINELAPVTDLPVNARNKTRKEKNKLASRACRLKKKAQHEANKIKLFGLQREHQQVVMAVYNVRKVLRESLAAGSESNFRSPMNSNVRSIIDQCSTSVAGKTSDYVNSVLEKVVSGFIDGGLQT